MFNTDVGLATLVKDLEWEILEIGLDHCVIEFASHETFHIKNTEDYYYVLGKDMEREGDVRIMRIPGSLVLCGITYKTFIVGEGYV